ERNQPGVDGRHENPSVAARLPRRDAAVGEIAVAPVARNLSVVDPPLPAGYRVEREYLPQRRRQIQRAVHVDGSRFEGRGAAVWGLIRIAGMEGPGDLQLPGVLLIDRRERREPLTARIASVRRPVP